MNLDLDGKLALVTGASGGIGRATALELARRGADVAVHYLRNELGAHETAASIAALGRAAEVFQADVSQREAVSGLAEAMLRRFSRVDVLVNNAGDLVERRPLGELSESLWRQVLDLNLTGTFFVSQAVVPGMVERRSGAIVNMSSWPRTAGGLGALACGPPGRRHLLTKAMAMELALLTACG
jgi:3-oxoacyl-[acyl-carrier protein] reductase